MRVEVVGAEAPRIVAPPRPARATVDLVPTNDERDPGASRYATDTRVVAVELASTLPWRPRVDTSPPAQRLRRRAAVDAPPPLSALAGGSRADLPMRGVEVALSWSTSAWRPRISAPPGRRRVSVASSSSGCAGKVVDVAPMGDRVVEPPGPRRRHSTAGIDAASRPLLTPAPARRPCRRRAVA